MHYALFDGRLSNRYALRNAIKFPVKRHNVVAANLLTDWFTK